MIEVGVRQQDQIDVWELRSLQRRRDQPFDAYRHRAHSDAAAVRQNRIGEDREPVHLEQHCAVA
jgi:hypothetical protein